MARRPPTSQIGRCRLQRAALATRVGTAIGCAKSIDCGDRVAIGVVASIAGEHRLTLVGTVAIGEFCGHPACCRCRNTTGTPLIIEGLVTLPDMTGAVINLAS